MTTRITVDPITRIEGHLRIDVEVDDGKGHQGLVVRADVARYREDPGRP